MTRSGNALGATATVVVLIAGAAGYLAFNRKDRPAATPSLAAPVEETAETPLVAASSSAPESSQGFLYGRITTVEGAIYEGRLRWAGTEEAFWDDAFNGFKRENPWLAQVPLDRRPMERRPISVFGIVIAQRERPSDVGRPFMARFGEIARIEGSRREVSVTLKSGTTFVLDRYEAGDFDDPVRVWDGERGVVDLDSLQIRSIELLRTPILRDAPPRLYGTARTKLGEFTGFVAWNRDDSAGSDELSGHVSEGAAEGELNLRLDGLRSIARRSEGTALVVLRDGSEVVLSRNADVGRYNRGIYVADRRYGRVQIAWDAFERLDFSPPGEQGSGPAYDDFPPGSPLAGRVTTRDGSRFSGRLVFDLDETVSSETLDAAASGVDYSIPFGRIAAIAPPSREAREAARIRVTLQSGEALELEPTGDLGEGNAGLLIFVDGSERPEYVPWSAVAQVDFDRGTPR